MNIEEQTPRRHKRYLLLLFVLTIPLLNPWVRGDGVGYYAYARAPLIQHNLDFTQDYLHANDSFRADRLDADGRIKPQFFTSTRHLENHFTVGPALLWSPFLLVAHCGVFFARAFGTSVAVDGFSAPYRYAMALGTGLYGFLALLLSYELARKYVSPTWAFLATLAIWWGSSLPVYMYFNPSWSHAHSAFAAALFVWYWDATREHRSALQWVILGVVCGLMLDMYYANLMIASILAVEAITQYGDAFGMASRNPPLKLLARHLLFGATVLVVMLPTFVSRWVVYGGPFETGYLSIRNFLWGSPALFDVLFSSDHGLLAWTPILFLSFVGLVLFAVRSRQPGLAFLVAALAYYLFFAVYPDWDGISSYGSRFFVSLTSLFVLGLAVTLERAVTYFRQPRTAQAIASVILFFFVVWNLGLIYQWGTHLVPARGPISFRRAAYNQFAVVPRKLFSHLQTYFLRRGDLMQQIERGDQEQMNDTAKP